VRRGRREKKPGGCAAYHQLHRDLPQNPGAQGELRHESQPHIFRGVQPGSALLAASQLGDRSMRRQRVQYISTRGGTFRHAPEKHRPTGPTSDISTLFHFVVLPDSWPLKSDLPAFSTSGKSAKHGEALWWGARGGRFRPGRGLFAFSTVCDDGHHAFRAGLSAPWREDGWRLDASFPDRYEGFSSVVCGCSRDAHELKIGLARLAV